MTSAVAGIGIAEDIELIAGSVRNGSWIDGTLGVTGAGLEALAYVADPVGMLLQSGAAWLLEHVRPLSAALDQLAGDPVPIEGNARTWREAAEGLREQAAEIGWSVRHDLSEWEGAAAEAYRARSGGEQHATVALAAAAETMAALIEGAGTLVAAVRLLVRDAIAFLVSRLVTYAAEAAFSLGLATPLVVGQVTAAISAWGARIAGFLRGLLHSLRNLVPLTRALTDHIGRAAAVFNPARAGETLNRVRRIGDGPPQPFKMRSVRQIAARYGIDISDLRIELGRPTFRGACGQTLPNGTIKLYMQGFRSEEDLARTLVHERFHRNELAAGRPYPRDDAEFDAFEDRAYAHEDEWWENQPIRPEPRAR
ncbi:hypothetical protein AMIS_12570 [Actinoplanes missouriensis 431]|uniref:Uncharacterized protein n=1 Tax=Actinoplanes missouriensis (strain ATCC 14538 / DSM 43046 / CBS 188.64 / JCM 3121 / NBRC 102363 / NCIMB 12654 / NRRL B-3342 / UNCC 431) TaxID=512565 RepID=I0H0E0_ACTM4|nr:hypothetical protein [Actinoplanes missouriensis]BAL86477.1 hypothetical protein AMIS_12570 [Actinoplanes missouriensis 431]